MPVKKEVDSMKKIVVLISTYNGEKYLKEQLDSIINQDCDEKIDILVRDDGSTDKTVDILKSYKKKGLLDYYLGENLKPARSFINLLKHVNGYDYYFFSDQDDVWESGKISRAIKILNGKDNYAMYFSCKNITDENLKVLKCDYKDYVISFESAMIRNIATGCTVAINNKLKEKITSKKIKYIIMHDSFIYRTCLLFNGYVYYDKTPYIKYRQHGTNVIGYNENTTSRIKRRIKSFLRNNHERKKAAIELLRLYKDEIDEDKKIFLENMSTCKDFKSKIYLLKNKNVKTESKEINIVFRLALLLNKI